MMKMMRSHSWMQLLHLKVWDHCCHFSHLHPRPSPLILHCCQRSHLSRDFMKTETLQKPRLSTNTILHICHHFQTSSFFQWCFFFKTRETSRSSTLSRVSVLLPPRCWSQRLRSAKLRGHRPPPRMTAGRARAPPSGTPASDGRGQDGGSQSCPNFLFKEVETKTVLQFRVKSRR